MDDAQKQSSQDSMRLTDYMLHLLLISWKSDIITLWNRLKGHSVCTVLYVWVHKSVSVHTVAFPGSNEELINWELLSVPWAGGWNNQAEHSPNTQAQAHTHHTHMHDGSLFDHAGKGGLQQVWTMVRAKRDRAVVGPILVMGFGFSTGIQNQLAVLYWLWSNWRKNEGRFILNIWKGTVGGHSSNTLPFHFESLGAHLSLHTWQIPVWACSERINFSKHLLWKLEYNSWVHVIPANLNHFIS